MHSRVSAVDPGSCHIWTSKEVGQQHIFLDCTAWQTVPDSCKDATSRSWSRALVCPSIETPTHRRRATWSRIGSLTHTVNLILPLCRARAPQDGVLVARHLLHQRLRALLARVHDERQPQRHAAYDLPHIF